MKKSFLAFTFSILISAASSASERSIEWANSIHSLGEHGGDSSQVVSLLGKPVKKKHIVVANPRKYMRGGPIHCQNVAKNQRLEAWFYPIIDGGYWVILSGKRIQCIAFEPVQAPLF